VAVEETQQDERSEQEEGQLGYHGHVVEGVDGSVTRQDRTADPGVGRNDSSAAFEGESRRVAGSAFDDLRQYQSTTRFSHTCVFTFR